MKTWIGWLALPVVFALVGCGGGGSSDNSTNNVVTSPQALAAFAVSDARAIMIAPGDSVLTASARPASVFTASSDAKLLKVTENGHVEEVTAVDADGNAITTLNTPSAIYDVNDEFLVIGFSSSHYLVRRSDGAAFDLDAEPASLWDERIVNRSPFRSDADGNIYFVLAASRPRFSVQRILGATGSDLKRERVTPEGDEVFSFAVGGSGHVAFTGSPQPRVVSPSGALFNISNETAAVWTTPSGKLHFNISNDRRIMQIDLAEDGTIAVNEYGELPEAGAFHLLYFLHEVAGRLYLIERRDSNNQLVLELYNETQQPRLVDGLPLTSVKTSAADAEFLYLAGTDDRDQPRLGRLNPLTDSFEDVLTPNTYDVYEIAVSSTGIITFGATQMSNGARVLGEVDAQGNLMILRDSLSRDISVLARVN